MTASLALAAHPASGLHHRSVILGRAAENFFCTAIQQSNGDYSVFVTQPSSALILVIVLLPTLRARGRWAV